MTLLNAGAPMSTVHTWWPALAAGLLGKQW